MMKLIAALVILAITVQTVSAGVLYTRTVTPAPWRKLDRAAPLTKVSFTLALQHRNLDVLEDLFWAVSDPTSPKYQHFMTSAELNALVAPEKSIHDSIVDWLVTQGVARSMIYSLGDALDVTASAAVVERVFSTEVFVFEHADGSKIARAFGSYSLPEHIHRHVEMVTGVSTFPIPHLSRKMKDQSPMQTTEAVIPQTLQIVYNLPMLTPGSHPEITVGVIEYEQQYFTNDDTVMFASQVGITGTQNITKAHTVGTNDPTQPQTESSLDVQMVQATNTEATPWFWIEDGTGWLYAFATHIQNVTNYPAITSTSYGWWEGDQCDIDPTGCQQLGVDSTGYVQAVNVQFQKVGMMGISLLVASGDSGANGRTDPDCSIPQLRPAFPSSSPYVTSVGATELRNGTYAIPNAPAICTSTYSCLSGGVECAVSITIAGFASGGGFSNISTRPSYQDAAVMAYLNNPSVMLPPASYYAAGGRGAPDIGALGHNGLMVQGGQLFPVGGTSMASPIWAGVIGLLAETFVKKTGAPFGFLNPFLYQMYAAAPMAFNDITIGDNICTEDGCSAGCQGFYAAKGWDPVTGLGSPNFPNMLAYVNTLADKIVANRKSSNFKPTRKW